MHLLQVMLLHKTYSTLTFTTFYMDESPDVLRIRTGIPPAACLPADDRMPYTQPWPLRLITLVSTERASPTVHADTYTAMFWKRWAVSSHWMSCALICWGCCMAACGCA